MKKSYTTHLDKQLAQLQVLKIVLSEVVSAFTLEASGPHRKPSKPNEVGFGCTFCIFSQRAQWHPAKVPWSYLRTNDTIRSTINEYECNQQCYLLRKLKLILLAGTFPCPSLAATVSAMTRRHAATFGLRPTLLRKSLKTG